MQYRHIPVLLNEVISLLDPRPGQNFVDCTLGGGGYSKELLKKVGPGGKVLAIDLDEDAINEGLRIGDGRLVLAQGNFSQLDKIVKQHGFPLPDGIVADLGLSSNQLDQGQRGLSFQRHELLDMRFDQKSDRTDARYVLNNYDEARLKKVFKDYGEEKFSGKIAEQIVRHRSGQEIKYSDELYRIIESSLPKPVRHRAADSARRVFQAIRIEVNNELESLREMLQKGFDLLLPGGRMAIVSFHSLEDRIVKKFFSGLASGCVCPPEFPHCICGKNPKARLLGKKPVTAGKEEQDANSRSKPAKLRAIEKI